MATRGRVALAAVAGVVVGSVATVGLALARGVPSGAADRPSAEQAAAPVTVPITRQVLVDSEVVSGALGWADTADAIATDGVVTAMPLADSTEIHPGQVVVEVDDRPVVALHMRFGLWRDLATGDSGADVREVHTALAELGRYRGDVGAPVGPATFAALGEIDPRLGTDPVAAGSLVAVDTTGSTLDAAGIGIGSRLGERSISVRRHSDRIAVDDGGLAAQYAAAGQQIELYDASGASTWRGQIAHVEVESSRTLLTVTGDDLLPTDPAAASIVVSSTGHEVLAVPRVAIAPQADGTSTISVVGSADDTAASPTQLVVETGLCAKDLCEITVRTPAGTDPPGPGDLVLVP